MIATFAISGCASTGTGFRFIEPSRKDVLTDGTKRQILEHNLFCEKQGTCKRAE